MELHIALEGIESRILKEYARQCVVYTTHPFAGCAKAKRVLLVQDVRNADLVDRHSEPRAVTWTTLLHMEMYRRMVDASQIVFLVSLYDISLNLKLWDVYCYARMMNKPIRIVKDWRPATVPMDEKYRRRSVFESRI